MDQCTHKICAKYWEGIIKACGEYLAGELTKSWMDKNGKREQSY